MPLNPAKLQQVLKTLLPYWETDFLDRLSRDPAEAYTYAHGIYHLLAVAQLGEHAHAWLALEMTAGEQLAIVTNDPDPLPDQYQVYVDRDEEGTPLTVEEATYLGLQ
jgi:hypothetical protein